MILREFLDKSTNGGFCDYNVGYKTVLVQDVIKLNFKKLYTHLILKFYDEGLINDYIIDNLFNKHATNIEYVRELLKKSDGFSEHEHMLLNSFYGYLGKNDFDLACRISGYMYSIMYYYYHTYYDSIIYIDTDTIFMSVLKDEDFIKSIDIPYEINIINQFYLFDSKRFLIEENNKIVKRGIRKNSSSINKMESVINEMELIMRSNIRERKLNELEI